MVSLSTSYDELAYPSYAFPLTHPDNLATITRLFGLSTPPVEQCRVLELGCASAGNLIPMAANLPHSTFVGVDLSTRQIAAGQAVVDALGLTNIDLRAVDLAEIDPDFGRYDYIICHGVFSWVSEAAQEQILNICRQNLDGQGVAYVSYNVYPGWHEGRMLRDMLQYHCRDGGSAVERVEQARRFIGQVAALLAAEDDPRATFLRPELQHISRPDKDAYLHSEYLADENRPMMFHELVERARAHGLQYLSNADARSMWVDDLPESIANLVSQGRNVVEAQQTLDFVRNRRFRSTLLCHGERSVDMNLQSERLDPLSMKSWVSPDPSEGDLASNDRVTFRSSGGSVAWVVGPVNRLAMAILSRKSPLAIGFDDLLAETIERLTTLGLCDSEPATSEQMRSDLAATLTRLYFAGIVELHSFRAEVANELSTRPRASTLARMEATRTGIATTQWHGRYYLSPLHRAVLCRLDGSICDSDLAREIDGSLFDETDSSPREEQVRDVLEELLAVGLLVA